MLCIRIFCLIAAFTLASSCQPRSSHPNKSIGIEQYPETRDLFELAEMQRKKHGLPALGIGIIRDGRIIALGMAGERRRGSGDWATLDDLFDIASCSKSFTATIAAMLVEKGVARWDMTIKEIFPELEDKIHPAYSDVTLEMFLRHRSGLDQWMRTNDRWKKWHRDHVTADATEKRYLFTKKVLNDQPRYTPGTDVYYCNDGYLAAGSMMEQITGKSWENLVQEMLFEPLGLHSMQFGAPPPDEDANVAWGHEPGTFGSLRKIKPNPDEYGDPPFGSPGGFLYCTVPDLLQYLDFHIQGANGNGILLKSESFNRLHTPLSDQHFALGWEVEMKRDAQGKVIERSIYHGGFSGRARANMWFCPESRTGTVIVYNHGGDETVDAYVEIFYALLEQV